MDWHLKQLGLSSSIVVLICLYLPPYLSLIPPPLSPPAPPPPSPCHFILLDDFHLFPTEPQLLRQFVGFLSFFSFFSRFFSLVFSSRFFLLFQRRTSHSLRTGMHYGTKPGHFETSKIHSPTSEGVSEVSERASE